MKEKIICLSVDGGSLTDEMRNGILNGAIELHHRHGRRLSLSKRKHGLDGLITTDYRYGTLGGMSGIIFKTEFEAKERTIKADVILTPNDLVRNQEARVWLSVEPYRVPHRPVWDN